MEHIPALLSTFQPGSLPGWGTFIVLLSIIGSLWLKNKKIVVDSEGGIRDHYAKELSALRLQFLAVQAASDERAKHADERYDAALTAADGRHAACEETCDGLRKQVAVMQQELDGMRRQISSFGEGSIRIFEPRADLPEDMKDKMRSLKQDGTGEMQ